MKESVTQRPCVRMARWRSAPSSVPSTRSAPWRRACPPAMAGPSGIASAQEKSNRSTICAPRCAKHCASRQSSIEPFAGHALIELELQTAPVELVFDHLDNFLQFLDADFDVLVRRVPMRDVIETDDKISELFLVGQPCPADER